MFLSLSLVEEKGSSNLLGFIQSIGVIHGKLETELQLPSIGVLVGVCSPALVLAD
jgi:hypothetical protein